MRDRNLFLYGDFQPNASYMYRPFIRVCGTKQPTVAVLMQGDHNWETCFKRYSELLCSLGALAKPVVPPPDSSTLDAEALHLLEQCDGILVGGGHTFRYIQLYTQSPVIDIIRERYHNGTPYAGISAGAILTIRLGIVPHFAIKPHFSQQHRFGELLKKMESGNALYGLGMDNAIGIQLTNETDISLFGGEKCYIFRRSAPNEYHLTVLQPRFVHPHFFTPASHG